MPGKELVKHNPADISQCSILVLVVDHFSAIRVDVVDCPA